MGSHDTIEVPAPEVPRAISAQRAMGNVLVQRYDTGRVENGAMMVNLLFREAPAPKPVVATVADPFDEAVAPPAQIEMEL